MNTPGIPRPAANALPWQRRLRLFVGACILSGGGAALAARCLQSFSG